MGFIAKRRQEYDESLKAIVPDCWKQFQDPPLNGEAEIMQLPRLEYEPLVTVGIMVCHELSVDFDSNFISVQMPECTFHGSYTIKLENGKLRFEGELYDELCFNPVDNQDITAFDGHFTLHDVTIGKEFHWQRQENQSFKGSLRLVADGNKIQVINDISVEAYLYSVISSEMNAMAPIELLKAHAIISRSWLLKPILDPEQTTASVREIVSNDEIVRWYERDAHTLFDVCADDHCQRYQGIARASVVTVAQAVEETRGVVLSYNGHICDARFSKACGGVTELFENCWAATPYPYLSRVVDAEAVNVPDLTIEANADKWIRGQHSSWCNTTDKEVLRTILNDYDCETKDFYRWSVRYTKTQLTKLIHRKSGIDFGEIRALQPLQRGVSGRIIRLKIVGEKRTMIVGKELEIRRWLSETHLFSSAFVVDFMGDEVVLTGAGWGHGVGLCQIGAAVMASKGKRYNNILSHYFPKAGLQQIYR